MEKRFGAAVFTAVVLHAALIALTVLRSDPETPRALGRSVIVRAAEVELFMLTEDDSRAVRRDQTSSMDKPSESHRPPASEGGPLAHLPNGAGQRQTPRPRLSKRARLTRMRPSLSSGPALRPRARRTVPPKEAAAFVRASIWGSTAPSCVALRWTRANVDRVQREHRGAGPSFRSATGRKKAVRSVAQRSAPWEGRALLTLVWDAKGQLLSVTSSAASSSSEEWQRLAKDLGSQLATHPNVGEQGGGRRVVYLVKSDLVLPDSKRSVLPAAKLASAEQLRENNLPPASAINFGVKADGSAAATRVWFR